jgi:hypothetical protein
MPNYDPHSLDQVDYIAEMEVHGKGRLVKARLSDQPLPNVDWFWIPLGNCKACKYYGQSTPTRTEPQCLNKKIKPSDFYFKYMASNDCPEFEVGFDPLVVKEKEWASDILDIMKAIGLVKGKPSQRVEVIVNELWSTSLAERAHREAGIFLGMAQYAHYLATHPGASNDPSHLEYVDMSDDLERAPVTP